MPKRLTTIRRSIETDRQLTQLTQAMNESAAEVQARAVAVLWERTHDRKHFELAQVETGICEWCGWDAGESDSE
jgi:predicted transcriptional regulator